ncbi:MAG: DUF1569 domain-containing protein [Gemmataceae bacterium]
MSTIKTQQVTGRRTLDFKCIDDIRADVEQLAKAEPRALGNWSAGQVLMHLAIVMNNSIDGGPMAFGPVLRFLVRLLIKRRLLNRRMSPGFTLPKRVEGLIPPPTTWDQGVEAFRAALDRLKTETKRAPHPAIGRLTNEEWDRLHCRHSELHLSFLVPA